MGNLPQLLLSLILSLAVSGFLEEKIAIAQQPQPLPSQDEDIIDDSDIEGDIDEDIEEDTEEVKPKPKPKPKPTGENQPKPEREIEFKPESTNESQSEEKLQPLDEFEIEDAESEADGQLPKTPQNPFDKPSIDTLIEKQFNDDMWRIMRGALPCLETSAACLKQLQDRAVVQSPLLRELDTRITEANDRINEAKLAGKRNIRLSVLTPALQYLLGPTPQPGQPQPEGTGIIDNVIKIVRGDVGLINGLLRVIGIPLLESSQGGNSQQQRNAIAIGDLQIKVAELQRNRAELADRIRERVAITLIKFDEARTDFQTAQIIGMRSTEQFKVFELRYVRGNSNTEAYLAQQNKLDNEKARIYSAWAKMRRSLFEMKLLVLTIKDAEI